MLSLAFGRQSPDAGTLIRTSGPALNSIPFNPDARCNAPTVGSAKLDVRRCQQRHVCLHRQRDQRSPSRSPGCCSAHSRRAPSAARQIRRSPPISKVTGGPQAEANQGGACTSRTKRDTIFASWFAYGLTARRCGSRQRPTGRAMAFIAATSFQTTAPPSASVPFDSQRVTRARDRFSDADLQ